MRIALCLAGQMGDVSECYKGLKRFLIEPLEPDVFIHTWEESKVSDSAGPEFAAQERITVQLLHELYHPKAAVIEKFDERYFSEIDGVVLPKEIKWEAREFVPSVLPRFAKMRRCDALRRNWEHTKRYRYDVVILLRPDISLSAELPNYILNDCSVIWHASFDIEDRGIKIEDAFLVSSSPNITWFTSVYEKLPKYIEKIIDGSPRADSFIAESLIRHHVKELGIPYKAFPSNARFYT